MPEQPDQKELMNQAKNTLSILMDISLSMAVFVLAKSCSENEISDYFIVSRQRLIDQGFDLKMIDELSNQTATAVMGIKKEMEGN